MRSYARFGIHESLVYLRKYFINLVVVVVILNCVYCSVCMVVVFWVDYESCCLQSANKLLIISTNDVHIINSDLTSASIPLHRHSACLQHLFSSLFLCFSSFFSTIVCYGYSFCLHSQQLLEREMS